MKPVRENSIVELLDKLLDKGLMLDADLIISVAGVPLIGIKLRAALAGIETMLEYGMMEAWDRDTREWYEREMEKREDIPLMENEAVSLRTFGSVWHNQGIIHCWRPGFWYLTNKRLFLWSKEPAEMLFEVFLDKIEGIMTNREPHLRNIEKEIYLKYGCDEIARVRVSNIIEFKEILKRVSEGRLGEIDVGFS